LVREPFSNNFTDRISAERKHLIANVRFGHDDFEEDTDVIMRTIWMQTSRSRFTAADTSMMDQVTGQLPTTFGEKIAQIVTLAINDA
jgi:hypothetical protein